MNDKKIVVLSSIYPGEGVPESFTPVVHYFAREWVAQGHQVIVFHNSSHFPFFYYWAPKFIRKMLVKVFKCALPEERNNKRNESFNEGVRVFRLPMFKIIPGRKFSGCSYKKQAREIEEIIHNLEFVPDCIVSHWFNPQILISCELKKKFKCTTAQIVHDPGKVLMQFDNYHELISSVDVWGMRSLAIKEEFETKFGTVKNWFHCYSGIPEDYYDALPTRNWEKCNRYIYVGYLLQRKYPNVVINSLRKYYKENEFNLKVAGDGEMRGELMRTIAEYNLGNRVKMYGRVSRGEVKELLDHSDVFIMISERETFGLVYLEAMARGCITIAARNSGMDGIIEHGVDGFLCEAGNENELIRVLQRISSLSIDERKDLSNSAVKKAAMYSDRAAAKNYIENVLKKY
jgi:glycosyltransferase involved in cell wall biosynthesis